MRGGARWRACLLGVGTEAHRGTVGGSLAVGLGRLWIWAGPSGEPGTRRSVAGGMGAARSIPCLRGFLVLGRDVVGETGVEWDPLKSWGVAQG